MQFRNRTDAPASVLPRWARRLAAWLTLGSATIAVLAQLVQLVASLWRLRGG